MTLRPLSLIVALTLAVILLPLTMIVLRVILALLLTRILILTLLSIVTYYVFIRKDRVLFLESGILKTLLVGQSPY